MAWGRAPTAPPGRAGAAAGAGAVGLAAAGSGGLGRRGFGGPRPGRGGPGGGGRAAGPFWGLRRAKSAEGGARGGGVLAGGLGPPDAGGPPGRGGDSPRVSIVVPLRDEEGSVGELVREVGRALGASPWAGDFELLLVDDGSGDGTWTEVRRAAGGAGAPAWLRGVRLRAGRGQAAALGAGFMRARGEYIVTLDGDLQNDPADIPALLARLQGRSRSEGAPAGGEGDEAPDMVCGRRARRAEGPVRRVPSLLANWLIGRVTGTRVRDTGCALRAFRRWVGDSLQEHLHGRGMHRFIPALAAAQGARIEEVDVGHRERGTGRSKYSALGRTPAVAIDLLTVYFLTRYLREPAQCFAWLGLWFVIYSVAIAAFDVLGLPLSNAALGAAVFSSHGYTLFVLGLMAEVLSRAYLRGLGGPGGFAGPPVRDAVGFGAERAPPAAAAL